MTGAKTRCDELAAGRCVVVAEAIADIAAQRATLLQHHFGPAEIAYQEGRHARTTAGLLAAKRALRELCHQLCPDRAFRESNFRLGHDAAGAPRLEAILEDLGGERWQESELLEMLFISISHTRDWAYGYALLEEAACPPRS